MTLRPQMERWVIKRPEHLILSPKHKETQRNTDGGALMDTDRKTGFSIRCVPCFRD